MLATATQATVERIKGRECYHARRTGYRRGPRIP